MAAINIIQFTPQVSTSYVRFTEVILTWSDDGGHTWSNRLVQRILIGQTGRRVLFRRIGSTRRGHGLDRIFELSGEPIGRVALSGAVFVTDPTEEAGRG